MCDDNHGYVSVTSIFVVDSCLFFFAVRFLRERSRSSISRAFSPRFSGAVTGKSPMIVMEYSKSLSSSIVFIVVCTAFQEIQNAHSLFFTACLVQWNLDLSMIFCTMRQWLLKVNFSSRSFATFRKDCGFFTQQTLRSCTVTSNQP
jgi:hypothetical protein